VPAEVVSYLLTQNMFVYDKDNNLITRSEVINQYTNPVWDEERTDLGEDYEYIEVDMKSRPKLYQQITREYDSEGGITRSDTENFGILILSENEDRLRYNKSYSD